MAQIFKKESHLDRQYAAAGKKHHVSPLWSLPGLAAVVIGLLMLQPILTAIGVAWLLICLPLLMKGLFTHGDQAALGAGIAGEAATANLIAQLPEGWYGIQNPVVVYQGKQSEMDMVAVGPGGVYIIETKHHNGRIVGQFDGHDWVQYKTGRRGGSYQKQFYSPVKQVGTHVYRLAHFLRQNGCQVHVTGMVFFTNPQATVEVYGTAGDIPVFAGQTGATLMTRQMMSGQALSPKTVKQVCDLLKQCI